MRGPSLVALSLVVGLAGPRVASAAPIIEEAQADTSGAPIVVVEETAPPPPAAEPNVVVVQVNTGGPQEVDPTEAEFAALRAEYRSIRFGPAIRRIAIGGVGLLISAGIWAWMLEREEGIAGPRDNGLRNGFIQTGVTLAFAAVFTYGIYDLSSGIKRRADIRRRGRELQASYEFSFAPMVSPTTAGGAFQLRF